MRGARDLLVKHGLGQYWHNPAACTVISKDEWKGVVFEAVEGREDVVLAARFAQMKGTAAARYAIRAGDLEKKPKLKSVHSQEALKWALPAPAPPGLERSGDAT